MCKEKEREKKRNIKKRKRKKDSYRLHQVSLENGPPIRATITSSRIERDFNANKLNPNQGSNLLHGRYRTRALGGGGPLPSPLSGRVGLSVQETLGIYWAARLN